MIRARLQPAEFLIKHTWTAAACLLLSHLSLHALAETVEIKLPSGIEATADFNPGKPTQPAVLLVHGFLQTRHSPPLSTLAANLSSKGYTTLSPTISLGIQKRQQSMPCEMVHTHLIHEELNELNYWVNWLANKGNKRIVLIGFSSTGNIGVLLHNIQMPHPAVKQSILISMNPVAISQAELQKTRATYTSNIENIKKPKFYSVGYCRKNYVATPQSYLSYAQYHATQLLSLVAQHTVPTEFIFGTSDTTLPDEWLAQIKGIKPQSQFTILKNANHFFEGEFEFDLADKVEQSLSRQTSQ